MKNYYESPEIEIVTFRLQDVLGVSVPESGTSSGYIDDPDPGLPDDGL